MEIIRLLKKRVFWYYFFLITGGLWNYLGLIQELMFSLSGYMMILIGLISIVEQKDLKPKKIIFLTFLGLVAYTAEFIGVNTGIIFGDYSYNPDFKPDIDGVPLAIVFAWISTYLGANEFIRNTKNHYLYAFVVSIIMTFFDFIMEPAAIEIGYWNWDGITVPLKNYLSWFGLSLIIGLISKFIKINFNSQYLRHLLVSQIIYFVLSY